jgi:transposase
VTTSARDTEIEALRQQVADRDAKLRDQARKIAELTNDVASLKAVVEKMLAQRGGGMKVPAGQGLLFAEPAAQAEPTKATSEVAAEPDDGSANATTPTKQASKKKGTPRQPCKVDTTGLPRVDVLHDVPEAQRIDPVTGKPLVLTGEHVSEELDYQRAKLLVKRHRRPIYGLPPEEAAHRTIAPVTADLPPSPIEGCAASPMLLAWLIVQKYGNHLPLYRQEEIFARDGLRLPRQTMCDWTLAAAEALKPIADRMLAQVCSGVVLQIDDTPVMCQAGRGEPNFQAYLWTFVSPQQAGVVYRFTAGRASQLLADEMRGFHGMLVGDGFSGNSAAANKVDKSIVVAGCWAHVIRKFRDAEKEAPGTSELLCGNIQRLYEVERESDERQLDREARVALRKQKSRPILAEIFSRVRRLQPQFSEAGLMGKALAYVRNQRAALRQFLHEGLAPIDNNACERSIRPIAIGRNNWLFAGSMRGGRAAAVLYTLIESCKLGGVDVLGYLADVLVRVATHPASKIDELLPANWAKHFAATASA